MVAVIMHILIASMMQGQHLISGCTGLRSPPSHSTLPIHTPRHDINPVSSNTRTTVVTRILSLLHRLADTAVLLLTV